MFQKLFIGLSQWLMRLACVFFSLNVLTLLYGVIARYVIGHSPFWMDELARYLIIATVMFAMSYVWLSGEHMRVNVIERVLSPGLKSLLQFYQWLVICGVSGYVAWISFSYALSITRFSTMGLGISKSIPMMALPIGFVSLALLVTVLGFRQIERKREDESC